MIELRMEFLKPIVIMGRDMLPLEDSSENPWSVVCARSGRLSALREIVGVAFIELRRYTERCFKHIDKGVTSNSRKPST